MTKRLAVVVIHSDGQHLGLGRSRFAQIAQRLRATHFRVVVVQLWPDRTADRWPDSSIEVALVHRAVFSARSAAKQRMEKHPPFGHGHHSQAAERTTVSENLSPDQIRSNPHQFFPQVVGSLLADHHLRTCSAPSSAWVAARIQISP
jgi:hypothetical protein